MEKATYKCDACGESVEIIDGKMDIPECCENPMVLTENVDFCQTASVAEHARLSDTDEPCDDGRAAKFK